MIGFKHHTNTTFNRTDGAADPSSLVALFAATGWAGLASSEGSAQYTRYTHYYLTHSLAACLLAATENAILRQIVSFTVESIPLDQTTTAYDEGSRRME